MKGEDAGGEIVFRAVLLFVGREVPVLGRELASHFVELPFNSICVFAEPAVMNGDFVEATAVKSSFDRACLRGRDGAFLRLNFEGPEILFLSGNADLKIKVVAVSEIDQFFWRVTPLETERRSENRLPRQWRDQENPGEQNEFWHEGRLNPYANLNKRRPRARTMYPMISPIEVLRRPRRHPEQAMEGGVERGKKR